jgi:hypothetical protein
MADVTPPESRAPTSSSGGLPAAVLIGIAVLLFVGMLFLTSIMVLSITRSGRRAPGPTATVTLVGLPAQPVLLPTTTPAPPATATPPPTATALPSATPTVDAAPTENTSFVTARSGANVRSGPGSTFPVVGLLGGGKTAPVIGKDPSGEWLAVTFTTTTGEQGWIAAIVVDLTGDAAALPVITPTPAASRFTAPLRAWVAPGEMRA